MDFEFAYDLEVAPGNEVIFVRSNDRHRKVRVWVTEATIGDNELHFIGNSLGSSVREIKAAKKDEPPVVVSGQFALHEGKWLGSITLA